MPLSTGFNTQIYLACLYLDEQYVQFLLNASNYQLKVSVAQSYQNSTRYLMYSMVTTKCTISLSIKCAYITVHLFDSVL